MVGGELISTLLVARFIEQQSGHYAASSAMSGISSTCLEAPVLTHASIARPTCESVSAGKNSFRSGANTSKIVEKILRQCVKDKLVGGEAFFQWPATGE